MAGQSQQEGYEFETTLMHGRYRTEQLQQYAREVATVRQQKQIEEAKQLSFLKQSRRARTQRVVDGFKRYVAPYVGDWIFILLLGVFMAILSSVIDFLIDQLGLAHQILSLELVSDNQWYFQLVLWVLFPLILVLFSVGFVQLISIHAIEPTRVSNKWQLLCCMLASGKGHFVRVGSGIPEMKTILRGVNLPNYLSLKTFVSKTVALITAVGSSLPIGKEGPFVHISSIIADIMTRIVGKYFKVFNHVFANEAHTNELLAAACAVGVSSNFAAPIGGVLFSIEVTSTYFAVRNYWRGFFGAVSGAFLFRLIAVWFKSEETLTVLFKTSFNIDFPFDPQEILAFAAIGVGAGFISALFVYYHRKLVLLRRRYRKYTKFLEYSIFIYPAVIVILFTAMTYPQSLGRYMAGGLTQRKALEQLFTNFSWQQLPNKYSLPDDSIQRQVLDQWANATSIFVSLCLFIVIKFLFTGIAIALPIPAGVFFPVFVIGAASGRTMGELMYTVFNGTVNGVAINPGGYAVVGAAAMAGGVTHTISTSVIVFELTGQITHILPVMIAVLISVAIASLLQPSFYDSVIQIKELPFLPDLKLHKYYNLYARDIMRTDLLYVSHDSTYRDLRQLLRNSKHSSFPLVDRANTCVLLGSVSRGNLWYILNEQLQGVYEHAKEIKQQMQEEGAHVRERSSSPRPSIVQSVSESFNKIFKTPSQEDLRSTEQEFAEVIESKPETSTLLLQLEEQQLSAPISIPHNLIDPSPFQLVEMTSLNKIHSLFALLTLSHAYVTSLGKLVGVVTLSDLSDAIQGRRTSPRYRLHLSRHGNSDGSITETHDVEMTQVTSEHNT